jgi:hypothetical protein
MKLKRKRDVHEDRISVTRKFMKRLRECINEGFLKPSYEAYKRKVLDALSSVGILIDSNKMNRAEEWIKDFYDDEMSAYDCANSLRADLARSAPSVTEAFERYATEIINSAPQSKRKNAVDLIKSMDNIKKAHFDHCIMSIAEKKKMDPKCVVKARGFDIMELVNDGKQAPSQIIDSISKQLLDAKEQMSVQEALEIIRESGKVASMSDYIDMVKNELIRMDFGESYTDSLVDRYYRKTVAFYFNEGFTPEETAEHIRALEDDEA